MDAEAAARDLPDCRIGEWTFHPAANELSRAGTRRKLEHRAARTLELLCSRRGAIVSQEEIVREIWNGRTVSPNSVPVVISDLRQALGDDARDPRHIETVAKRGYRLIGAEPVLEEVLSGRGRPSRRRLVAIALAVLVLGAIVLAVALTRSQTPYTPLLVSEVVNATGSPDYQPLAAATSEVIMANAQQIAGVEVFRANQAREGAVMLSAKLIIWSGRPTVMMSASDPAGALIWTGMTSGKEDLIPSEVAAAMKELSTKLATAD